jgi:hypothetical protein
MSTEFVIKANEKGTPEYEAAEVLLKGPELRLKAYEQPAFRDKDGHLREEARIRWWDPDAKSLRELAEIPGGSVTATGDPYVPLPELPCSEELGYKYGGDIPVFFGHYWRTWEPERGRDWTSKTACLDFSAVKGGPLVAYRWEGETELSDRSFVAFPAPPPSGLTGSTPVERRTK